MRLMRTTVTLAGVLLLGSLAGCAEYTTTGVPVTLSANVKETSSGSTCVTDKINCRFSTAISAPAGMALSGRRAISVTRAPPLGTAAKSDR